MVYPRLSEVVPTVSFVQILALHIIFKVVLNAIHLRSRWSLGFLSDKISKEGSFSSLQEIHASCALRRTFFHSFRDWNISCPQGKWPCCYGCNQSRMGRWLHTKPRHIYLHSRKWNSFGIAPSFLPWRTDCFTRVPEQLSSRGIIRQLVGSTHRSMRELSCGVSCTHYSCPRVQILGTSSFVCLLRAESMFIRGGKQEYLSFVPPSSWFTSGYRWYGILIQRAFSVRRLFVEYHNLKCIYSYLCGHDLTAHPHFKARPINKLAKCRLVLNGMYVVMIGID